MEFKDTESLVYLQQIDISTDARIKFQVNLRIDGIEVKKWSNWAAAGRTQYLNQEVTYNSEIELFVTWDHKISRIFNHRAPNTVALRGEQAIELLWESEDSITRTLTFDGHIMTIIFKFAPSATSKKIRDAVQEVQIAMENYRSLMSEVTQWRINTVTMYGMAISEVNSFVKAAVGVVRVTFDLLQEQKRHDDMIFDLADGMGRILPIIEAAQDLVSAKDQNGLIKTAITNLCELVETVTPFILGYVKRSPARRAANSLASPKDQLIIQDFRNKFYRLKEDFDRAINLESLSGISSIEEELLLRRLRPVETSGYTDSYKCMEGTREQILNNLVDWAIQISTPEKREKTNTSKIATGNLLWLYGIPGLGKTSVANSLCLQLHEKTILGGSFFCRRDDPVLREPKYVLPTLIYRLAGVWSPFGKSVATVLREDSQLTPDSTNILLNKALLRPLETLEMHPSHSFVLLVDALDECGDSESRRALLNGLSKISSRVPWLKVVVTSRPEPDIEWFFKKLDISSYSSLDLSTDEHARKDIRFFAEQRLTSVSERRHLKDWPSKSQIDRLVELSQGLYIFIETLWRFLDKQRNPEKSLSQVLERSPEEGLEDLYKLYALAITTIVGNEAEEFRKIVGAIICVSRYRPLREDTLAALLGFETSTIRSWVDDLGSILYRDGLAGEVRVRHLSIIDFLAHESCPEAFRIDFEQANIDMGKYSLKIMKQELKFNICDLETSSKANTGFSDLGTRIRQSISDALLYSCIHWTDHLYYLSDWLDKSILEMLSEFLKREKPLFWMEVLSLTANVQIGAPSLRKLLSRIEDPNSPLRPLLNDILRFIITFHGLISTSAAHIYISALPFSPSNSLLWSNVKDIFPNLLEIRRGRLESWPAPGYIWQGHDGPVSSIACSLDGHNIASGSYDFTIRIWDIETGTTVGEPLKGHTNIINCVAYSADGRYIASGSNDNTVQIWDSQTRALAHESLKHDDWVQAISFSPSRRHLVSGSKDGQLRIWDVERGATVGKPLTGHTHEVTSVAYSFDGNQILSTSLDQTIRFWDAHTGVPTKQVIYAPAAIQSMALSPNGHKAVCGLSNAKISTWDVEAGLMVGEPLVGHMDKAISIAYSPDGRYIVSGSLDGQIRIWDAESGASIGNPIRGDLSEVISIAFSADGQRIFSGFADGSIRIWDVTNGNPAGDQSALQRHTADITDVVYSPGGRYVASCAYDQSVRLWDPETGCQVGEAVKGFIQSGIVIGLSFSRDDRHIVLGCSNKTVHIWDIESSTLVNSAILDHKFQVSAVAFSPDGQYLLSCSRDRTIHVWDLEAQKPAMQPLTGHSGDVISVSFSPDGRRIVSGSRDKTIRIWNFKSGEGIGEPLKGHTSSVTSVAFSLDGFRIVSASQDNTVRVWDIDTGKEVLEPLKHSDWVKSVAYSPDGKVIVSAGRDKVIRIWDAQSGRPLRKPLDGHTHEINTISYSPNGRYIASGSGDRSIRIWDIQLALESGTKSSESAIDIAPTASAIDSEGQPPPRYANINKLEENFESQPNSNGWVSYNGDILFWVPEDCRNGLTSPAVMTMPTMGPHRVVRLDFKQFKYGLEWTGIYQP